MPEENSPGQEGETPQREAAALKAEVLRKSLRNSPWLAIAVLVHILALAVLSVIYLAHEKPREVVSVTAVSIAPTPLELPPAIEEPPEIIDRDSVPVLEDQEEGPVNPDEVYIPEAAPGREGEITDEIDPTKDPGIYNPDPEALSNLPSGATGGTPIGVGAVGHYGTGTPSAFVSRRAGGGGKGGGGLGQAGGGGRGGTKTEAAVLSALLWLKKHQSPDGRWDCDGFSALCEKNACDGPGFGAHDVGVTGLALLCFLGAGETHEGGPFKNTVKNGLKYLMSVQDEDGCFGERVGQQFLYDHACAALAMAEAYGMTQAKPFLEPAQKGINFVLQAQNPYLAWRYHFPPDGDNDTSVTGWMVMVLKSGKLSGLTIDEQALFNAVNWIDQVTDPQSGRTGYTGKGDFPARMPEMLEKFPPQKSESMTAVGVLTRIFAGHTLDDDPLIGKGVELLVAKPPLWEPGTGDIDFYYWYYATLAMHQVGGPGWETWNEAMKLAIIDHQRANEEEDEYGSWDPIDPWSHIGGRVYSTALNCLCMEVYYRYPRAFGTAKRRKRPKRPKRSCGDARRGRREARRKAGASAWALLAVAPVAPVTPAVTWGAEGPGAASGDEKILAKDDLEFARALSRHGYPDLAEEVLGAIERQAQKEPDEGLSASVLRLDLQEVAAYREPDPIKRIDLLAEVADQKEQFVETRSGTPAAEDVLNRLPDLYRVIGEQTAAVLQQDGSSPDTEQLRERGSKMFERAVDALKARRESLSERLQKEDPERPDPELELQTMIASYNLARTHYFHALLAREGSWAKTDRLESALAVLLDLQLDFADQLLCYEGFIYEGLCHKELGQSDQAVASFDLAIRLRETYERDPKGVYLMSNEAADIVSSAVLQKILLLVEKGDHAASVAIADDFFATTPGALDTLKGLAILAQQAEASRSLGDRRRLEEAAQKLIDIDPHGPAGERGRELLGEGGAFALSAADTLELAETSAGRGELERAVALGQQVLILARGTGEEADLGARTGLLLGALFAQRGWLHEAAVAWDASADTYAKGKDAPECLWRAVNCYLTLQSREQRPFYGERARTRMTELAQRYADHPYASMARIIEGQQLEAEQDFARAAEVFESVAPGTAGYEEALYRAGNAWSRHARKLHQDGETSAASEATAKAEDLLKKSQTALEAALARTLDTTAQERLRSFAFNGRVSLANLYLLEGVDRPADALALFEGMEKTFPGEAAVSTALSLRFRALQALGKVDEAMALLDAEIRANPNAAWIGSSAAALAQSLDKRATELVEGSSESAEADRFWRKAAGYYILAIRGQLEGKEAVRIEEMEAVANRLFVFALHFSGVPKDVDSFVDWSGTRADIDLLEQAARAYEAVLPLTPSYRTLINLARTLGFLGRWSDAAAYYAQLFERERFADTTTKTIDQEALRAKPELVFAYLEWGVCEREAGVKEADATRLSRASAIFETLVLGTAAGTKLWWQSKYYQLRTLVDRGEYEIADVALRSLERNWPEFDADQHGLRERFGALQRQLENKVFGNGR